MDKKLNYLYKLIFTFIINLTIIKVTLDALTGEMDLNSISIVFITTLITLILGLIFDKKPIVLAILLGGIISFLIILNIYYNSNFNSLIENINDFFLWTSEYIKNDSEFIKRYFNIFIMSLSLVVTSLIYITVFKFKRMYPIIIMATIFFLYRWFWYQDSAFTTYYIFIITILAYYIINRFKIKNGIWESENKDISNYRRKYLFLYSCFISVIIVLIAFILPKDYSPIKWRWMDNKVQSKFPEVTEWRNDLKKSEGYGESLEFDLTFTPYQNQEKRLGGNIEIDNTLVMEVESDRPLYLKGIVKDEYTGSYWRSSEDFTEKYTKGENIELNDVNLDNSSFLEYKVNYVNLTTSTIFTSYVPIQIDYEEEFYVSNEYEVYTNKVILNEKGYSVESRIPFLNKSMINETYNKDYKYLKLPNTVTNRTKELALEITKGKINDYDRMLALQDYLRENYGYSLTPGNDKYEDFVDNFIFEKTEGYCTYFASTLAVMGRTLDIPTRYVEGFITGDKNEEGIYEVYSKNAHAWVEAYISGYGWMIFEATPAYEAPNLEETIEEEETDEESDNEIDPNSINRDDMLQEILEEEQLDQNSGNVNLTSNDNSKSLVLKSILWIAFIIIVFIIAIILHFIINKKFHAQKMKNYNSIQKMKFYYEYILNTLDYLGYSKVSGETEKEFKSRININERVNEKLNDFFNTYIITVYGNKELSNEKEDKIKQTIKFLEQEIKREKGKFKYIKFFLRKRFLYNK
ncbi:transglutaminaseTgpA domain-containing protein [Senegalia massiliensis]|uniref:transglutaminase family protein n=1 Tax=Senegalia massiliensis TaxID=1720316 RepID=UPI00102FD9DC|nr:transglutaminaseTgpA domain-containing protein [Senegalia massiliensis]